MDETEKMTALKKAYAEIILNTAKEAAARIMVSERKAHKLNHDLSSTKDEALRLLLRLKQTMDFKINEAEVKSLDQQRRIDELEAQLQEAEDIVSSLRAELSEVHTKLEEITNNPSYSLPIVVEKSVYEDENLEAENRPYEAVSASETEQISHGTNGSLVANITSGDYSYICEPDVPSIIVRSKKAQLYRNGCTQRIRACEGNLLRGQFSLDRGLDHLKSLDAVIEDKQGENISMMAPIVAEVKQIEQEKPVDSKQVNDQENIGSIQASKSVEKTDMAAAKHRICSPLTSKSVSHVAKEACSAPSNSQILFPCSGINKSVEEDTIAQSCSPSTAPSDVTEEGVPEQLSALQTNDKLTAVGEPDVEEGKDAASYSVLTTQQSSCGDILGTPGPHTELDMNLSIVNLDVKQLEACDGLPSPPAKDRILKYTFQRKRKKDSVASDDSSSVHQENPLRRKFSNQQICDIEPNNCSAVAEASRDSRMTA